MVGFLEQIFEAGMCGSNRICNTRSAAYFSGGFSYTGSSSWLGSLQVYHKVVIGSCWGKYYHGKHDIYFLYYDHCHATYTPVTTTHCIIAPFWQLYRIARNIRMVPIFTCCMCVLHAKMNLNDWVNFDLLATHSEDWIRTTRLVPNPWTTYPETLDQSYNRNRS